MEEPEFTKDPGITEPLDDHLGQFLSNFWLATTIGALWLVVVKKIKSGSMCWWGTIGTYKERHAAERYLTNQKLEFSPTNHFRGILTIISIKNGKLRSAWNLFRLVFMMSQWRHHYDITSWIQWRNDKTRIKTNPKAKLIFGAVVGTD